MPRRRRLWRLRPLWLAGAGRTACPLSEQAPRDRGSRRRGTHQSRHSDRSREERDLSVHGWRPEPYRHVRPQAAGQPVRGPPTPQEREACLYTDGRHRKSAPGMPPHVEALRPKRAGRVRLVSARRRMRRRHLPDSLLRERRDQPRRQRLHDEHGKRPRGTPQPGCLGQLRTRERESESARLRRALGQRPRAPRRQPRVGHRLHAGHLSGDAPAQRPASRS